MTPDEAMTQIHKAAKLLAEMNPALIAEHNDAAAYDNAVSAMEDALGALEEAERPAHTRGRFLVCVDFDGVLNSYTSGWTGDATDTPDVPVKGAIEWLEAAALDERIAVCVYSSRSRYAGGRDAIMRWLALSGLSHGAMSELWFPTRKPPASLLIDDRAYTFHGLFPTIPQMLAFKPWYKQV